MTECHLEQIQYEIHLHVMKYKIMSLIMLITILSIIISPIHNIVNSECVLTEIYY